MKRISGYIAAGIATICLVITSCTADFEDFNTPKYQPTNLPASAFFPQMLDRLANPQQNNCQWFNTMYSCYGGQITAPHSWSRSTLFSTFNVDDAWNNNIVPSYLTSFYPSFFSVQRQTGSQGYTYALASVLRVYVIHVVASIQGPVPYTSVADGALSVPYDSEEEAWTAMFEELDEAIRVLKQAATVSGLDELNNVDRIYGGDLNKWIKFANTLKLRMAIRISGVAPVLAREKAEEAVRDGVMTSVSDSAYDHLNGRQPNGYNIVATWGELKANATLTAYMNGYNDPRREKYFTPQTKDSKAPYQYIGVRSGIAGALKEDYATASGLIYEGLTNTTPMPVMFAAEAYFLRAEGALKGWNMDGTAQGLYEEGIRNSMQEWGVTNETTISNYISNTTNRPASHTDLFNTSHNHTAPSTIPIGWSGASTQEQHLEQIITQKWIANLTISLEGWCDFRRTGYPKIFEPVNNLSQWGCTNERQVRRLRFPLNEYNTNRENVEAAIQMLSSATDSENTDLWWAKKANGSY
ncbi:MAG: SusD/RagB family nutrient-binding outer membrane lipoprotein [Alistipes sp.]|nr:SusD/RagB family nutrient-binding outer membrane lipoprotein [Alistipes sp.]